MLEKVVFNMNLYRHWFLLVATIVVGFLFFRLSGHYDIRFGEVEAAYRNGTAINLTKGLAPKKLSNLLLAHGYFLEREAADLAAYTIVNRLNQDNRIIKLTNDLNKRLWQIPGVAIDSSGSEYYRVKMLQSREGLGWNEEIAELYKRNDIPCGLVVDSTQKGCIEVYVRAEDTGKRGALKEIIDQVRGKDHMHPCPDVVIRLHEHYIDSDGVAQIGNTYYAQTNAEGRVRIAGLNEKGSYSVLPIRNGFEYGGARGTTKENAKILREKGTLRFKFEENEHKIRLFDRDVLQRIREDHTLTIRTPENFKNMVVRLLVLFFVVWWGLYFISLKRSKYSDTSIVVLLMLLTGLHLLLMFSLNDPLEDELYGKSMATGVIVGGILAIVLQYVDIVRFYQNGYGVKFDVPRYVVKWAYRSFYLLVWLCYPYRLKVAGAANVLASENQNTGRKCLAFLWCVLCLPFVVLDPIIRIFEKGQKNKKRIDIWNKGWLEKWDNKVNSWQKGWSYVLLAIGLTVLLIPLGKEVGGMKVNIVLGALTFQPSEIAKYLIVIFMAAFFSRNADRIVRYSEKGNVALIHKKLLMLLGMFLCFAALMGLYMYFGDMGPAMILAFTFIIMYSTVKSQAGQTISGAGFGKVATDDLAMLLYGVVSFVLFLVIGRGLGYMSYFGMAWFILWIVMGIAKKKQLFESALFFNLVIAAFVFGGDILRSFDEPSLDSVAERLEYRKEMSTNTWGRLGLDGGLQRPGVNTQVADGLWGLASGGLWGQGLGSGSPSMIPAYHTDMILESTGEQLGFFGVLCIILLVATLLRRTILVGYRTFHSFAFYLCLGIAVVTGVQFVIISLGSTGVIPLTGVTVPFFSFGMVSMILNLFAFGLVMSVSTNNTADVQEYGKRKRGTWSIGRYNYTVSILSWVYGFLMLAALLVFLHFQFFARNRTLIRPIFVKNDNGIPIVEYNPRIDQLNRKMFAGDIYDRRGVLLATSDRRKLYTGDNLSLYERYGLKCDTLKRLQRYYPFEENLYFILGDYNTKIFFSSVGNDRNPKGYMAEARHLAELRGYDNIKRDRKGNPVKVDLATETYRPGRYVDAEYHWEERGIQLRNYSALIPYLKAGVNSRKVRRLNARKESFLTIGRIKPKDIRLTLDVRLQMELQEKMEAFALTLMKGIQWNKARMSVVVLDAVNGDLLASANYPKADPELLKSVPGRYTDNNKDRDWMAYTDCDLGMTRPTAPGSTAKVMSALAGLRKLGAAAADTNNKNYRYYVDEKETVGVEPTGEITMREAIIRSSNCYFINLVNDHNLYEDLKSIYGSVGVQLEGQMPYCLQYDEEWGDSKWGTKIDQEAEPAIAAYRKWEKARQEGVLHKMNRYPAWFWSWGQGSLWVTPLTMARVVSIVANNGKMPVTRYRLNEKVREIPIAKSRNVAYLKAFMQQEATEHSHFNNSDIGGKTGTAERYLWDAKGQKSKPNDGWYICFIEGAEIVRKEGKKEKKSAGKVAVAVRIERLGEGRSGKAVSLTKEVVIPALRESGYINK
ncbi:MAG: FtsW/RodA/SpoVE family cell cycle protein [Bacteroides sp.]|nr:FtsW/RodA/SpoVE family cell cycle protein [Bacteroides sp.]